MIGLFTLLIFIVLTAFAAYCSAAETSIFSLSSHQIRAYQHDSDPIKRLIFKLLQHPRDLLVTVFMLNTFANVLIQNIASSWFGSEASWTLKVGAPLVSTLVLGEIVPKYMGLQNNLSISHMLAPSLHFFQTLLAPLRRWIVSLTAPISRVMFFFLKREKPMTSDEVEHLIERSEEQGLLQSEDVELLYGYLDFQELQLKDIMWPREDILYYDISQPLSKLVHLFVDQQCTRLPVCEQSLDNVIGIIDANQFFIFQPDLHTPFDLLAILEKPFYIPETTSAKSLLKMLNQQEQEIALVVNEYGTIEGLVTKEDLIEVVIGQVKDLRDTSKLFTVAGESEVIANGKWEIEELNNHFDADLESPNHMVTIGGWLTEKIGEIPRTGAKYQSNGLFFHVLESQPNRITRIYIRKMRPKTKPENSHE